MTDGLPMVGLECRDEGNHKWVRTGDAGRVTREYSQFYHGARFYRGYECERGCGITKVRWYDKLFMPIPELTRTTYTDKDYLVPGGIDPVQVGAYRMAEFDPNAKAPKRPRHLRSA